ncbi:hypothetical protein DPMN_155616 [Dreissena polymorpha]|uniref:Uncharacterized protein n=1 Tax=Dreissena polymorpha TaxID=45954 RepID=A0A9D4J6T1_DREPO|nr:hypothetical protein DPMN_155616 [Dreissena polymorpha]
MLLYLKFQVATDQEPKASTSTSAQYIYINDSVIKGYHIFKIKPPQVIEPLLIVDREYGNIHDHDSCLVWVPNLDSFPVELHHISTDEARFLKLSDIAGLPIGHVPRGLGGCFRKILDDNDNIFAKVTGEPTQSFPPWPAPNEKGGGAVIPCTYIIKTKSVDTTLAFVKSAIQKMEERLVMNVTVGK